MSRNRFHLEQTGEFGDDPSATRPREGTAIPTSNKSRRSRRRIYDLDTFSENDQLVVALKQRVKAMDERKSQLEAYLRSARTSQWVSKQEADQLTNQFRDHLSHIITTDSCRKLHCKITESEAKLKSLYQQVHDVRDMAVDLAKTCDMQREAIQSSQVEVDVLKSRFLRALPHVSGEVFLRESTSAENRPKQTAPLPPRIKPQPLPLPLPPDYSLVSKFILPTECKRIAERSLSHASALTGRGLREVAGPCPQAIPTLQKVDSEIQMALNKYSEFSAEALKLQALLEKRSELEIRAQVSGK